MNTVIAATFGAVLGLGVWMILMGLDGQRVLPRTATHRTTAAYRNDPQLARRSGYALAAGAAAWLITSWPMMGILFAIGVAAFWGRLGTVNAATQIAERAEAIAAWTDQVAAGISAGVQINGAIRAAADHASPLIETEAKALATNLEVMTVDHAVGIFAHDLSNPASDGVCAAIALADRHGSSKLTEMLEIQATQTREDVRQLLEITASRQQHVTSARSMIGLTVFAAVALRLMSREFFALYDTWAGQLVLAAVGTVFITGFQFLSKLGSQRHVTRYFTGHTIEPVTP